MISGKYLGEIACLALQKLVKCGNLFGGKSSTKFDTFEAFESKYVSIIEGRFVIKIHYLLWMEGRPQPCSRPGVTPYYLHLHVVSCDCDPVNNYVTFCGYRTKNMDIWCDTEFIFY